MELCFEEKFLTFNIPSLKEEMLPKKASPRHQLWTECPVGTWNCARVFPCPGGIKQKQQQDGFSLQSMSLIIYGTMLSDCRIRMYSSVFHYFQQNICIDSTAGSLDPFTLGIPGG